MVVTAVTVTNASAEQSSTRGATNASRSDVAIKTTTLSTTSLVNVAFLNQTHGYGVVRAQGPVTCGDAVARASDGRSTFSAPVPVVSWSCNNDEPVSTLAFDSHGDGFVHGPQLFITHNAGATWTRGDQPEPVFSVVALGSSIWMWEGTRPVPTSASRFKIPLRLLSSSDGGRTWSVLPSPAGADLQSATGLLSTALVRVNRTSAYVTTNAGQSIGLRTFATPLWFTNDAGVTWSSHPNPCGGYSTTLSAAPDGTLFDVCASEPGTGEQMKETLRYREQGRRWQIRSWCPLKSVTTHCTTGSQVSRYVDQIHAVSDLTVFLVGDRSSLEVTRDGGVTWSVVARGLGGDAGGTFQVILFNATSGIVFGDGEGPNAGDFGQTLWSTSDGGVHWATHHPHVT